MKQCLPILAAILLVGCTTAPTPALTPTSTHTPSATPTPTLAPTATPDPNMPEGATGQDGEGLWTREIKGRTEVWIPIRLINDEEHVAGHWFRSQMNNGDIDLIDESVNLYGGQDVDVMFRASVMDSHAAPTQWGLMRHVSVHDPAPQDVYGSFTTELVDRFFWRSMWNGSTDTGVPLSKNPDFQEFYRNFTSGGLSLTVAAPINTARATEYASFSYTPTIDRYEVLVVDPAAIEDDPAAFHAGSVHFRYSKANGSVVYALSATTQATPDRIELNRLYLSPYFFMVMIGEKLPRISTLSAVTANGKIYDINLFANTAGPRFSSDGAITAFIEYGP